MAKKRGPGKPPKVPYRASFHPQDFLEQSKNGKTVTQIAAKWDIDRGTVYDWAKKYPELARALKKGSGLSEAWWMNLLQSAAIGKLPPDVKFNLGAFVWATKNMFRWSDRLEQEIKSDDKVSYKLNWADDDSKDNPAPKKDATPKTDLSEPSKV